MRKRTALLLAVVASTSLSEAERAFAAAVSVVGTSNPSVVPLAFPKQDPNESVIFADTFDADTSSAWVAANANQITINESSHTIGATTANNGTQGAFNYFTVPNLASGEVDLYLQVQSNSGNGTAANNELDAYLFGPKSTSQPGAAGTAYVNQLTISPGAGTSGGVYLRGNIQSTGAVGRTANLATAANNAAKFATATTMNDYRFGIVPNGTDASGNNLAELTFSVFNGSSWTLINSSTTDYQGNNLELPASFNELELNFTNLTSGTSDTRTFVDQVLVSQHTTTASPYLSVTSTTTGTFGPQITNAGGATYTTANTHVAQFDANGSAQASGNNALTITNNGGSYVAGHALNIGQSDPSGTGVAANSNYGGIQSGNVKLGGYSASDQEIVLLNVVASSTNGGALSEATTAQIVNLVSDLNTTDYSNSFVASLVSSDIASQLPLYNLEIKLAAGTPVNGYFGFNLIGYANANATAINGAAASPIYDAEVSDIAAYAAAAPEPASIVMLLGGVPLLLGRRRRGFRRRS